MHLPGLEIDEPRATLASIAHVQRNKSCASRKGCEINLHHVQASPHAKQVVLAFHIRDRGCAVFEQHTDARNTDFPVTLTRHAVTVALHVHLAGNETARVEHSAPNADGDGRRVGSHAHTGRNRHRS